MRCPYCAEDIPDDTVICPYCRSDVRVPPILPEPPHTATEPSVGEGEPTVGEEALRFSHSGTRYLLGFGTDFFGIWDRGGPAAPIARFPRTDEGWRTAWIEYTRLEPHPAEVALPQGPPRPAAPTPPLPAPFGEARAAPARPVSPAWWLLPILFGTIGGVIAWAATRQRDQRTARNMLVTGILLSLVFLVIYLASGSR
jgi:hypothetical protein